MNNIQFSTQVSNREKEKEKEKNQRRDYFISTLVLIYFR